MVGRSPITLLPWSILADAAQPAAENADGAIGAKMLAALAGLIILGVAMLLLTWLGARVVRRYMNPPSHKPDRSKYAEFGVDDWVKNPRAADTESQESKDGG